MNIEDLRYYCISKPGVEESFPFGPDTLVFKVSGKMFALTGLSADDRSINLKCDPAWAIELREQYPCIQPGFHMNKKHWNTVYLDGSVEDTLVKKWIDHSYELVFSNLRMKKKR
jgi:predicted DNA-binding protein (MmcQ/YjbR family)